MNKLLAILLSASALLSSQTVLATTYAENGDSGITLATIQSVANGTTAISGTLSAGDAADVFKFSWGGGYLQIDTIGSANFDSMLYVFNLAGSLLAFNDDYSGLQSLIGTNLAAGDYLVGINTYSGNYNGNLDGMVNSNSNNNSVYTIHFNSVVNDVPEPSSLALLGLSIVGVAAARRRQA